MSAERDSLVAEPYPPSMVRVRDDVRSQWAGFTLKVVQVQARGRGSRYGGPSRRVDYLVVMPDGSPNGWYYDTEVEVVR